MPEEPTVQEIRDWQDWLTSQEPILQMFEKNGVNRGTAMILLSLNLVIGLLSDVTSVEPDEEEWQREHRTEYEDRDA